MEVDVDGCSRWIDVDKRRPRQIGQDRRTVDKIAETCRDFCPNRLEQGWNVLEVAFGHEEWAFIKLTGRWPLWNFPDLVGTEILTCCPLCATRHVSVTHVLKACRGTLQLFLRSGLVDFTSRTVPTPTFLMCLFHSSAGVQVDTARIRYVGLVIRRVALALRE